MCFAEWLTAIGTLLAVIVALVLALWGQQISQWLTHPVLYLDAKVQQPDADKVQRWSQLAGGHVINLGEYYFFRLSVSNTGNAAAKDVQIFLSKVEQLKAKHAENISRFTPMNLVWTNTERLSPRDRVTKPVLLAHMPPVFCDLIHIGDPQGRALPGGDDLDTVPKDKAVLGLDVEIPTYSKGHLLEPGTYRLSLTLAASNCSPTQYVIEIWFPGEWFPQIEDMLNKGIRIEKPRRIVARQEA